MDLASGSRSRWDGPLLSLAAQFSQAGVSLVVQLVAIRTLSLNDFGFFAIGVGLIVLFTAIVSGYVGDPLTVLDRQSGRVRVALQRAALVSLGLCLVISGALASLLYQVDPLPAVAFSLASVAFVAEDIVRRWLMACRRFAQVVAVDATYGLAVGIILLLALRAQGEAGLSLTQVFAAIAIGQVLALMLGIVLLPSAERRWVSGVPGAWGTVHSLGIWRSIQNAIRPGTLAVIRWLVLVVAGAAAVGSLEANRVLVAPALLAVQGLGSFLLVHMAEERRAGGSGDLGKADRIAGLLGGGTVAMALLLTAATPWISPLLLGPEVPVDPLMVLGWGTMAIGVALTLPYSSLAAVHGGAHRVVLIRAIDAAFSIALAWWLLAAWGDAGVPLVPFALGLAALVGAVVQRWTLRRELARGPGGAPPTGARD